MRKCRLVSFVCVVVLMLGTMAGCGTKANENTQKKDEIVMTVGDHEIKHDELMLYCILELLSGTMSYEDVQQDEVKYKEAVIDSIVEAKTAVDAATDEGMEFTADDESTRDSLIKNFTSYVTKEVRDEYGISDELINSVFNDTSIMNKMETETRNKLGQKLTEQYKEEYKDYNFQRIYYVTFPKVKSDDDGAPQVDDNGDYIKLDDAELAEQKKNAEAAVKEINDGADAKEVAKKYGVDSYCEEKSSYVGGYSDDMNDIMGNLTAGQCTDIYESDTSYYAIAVLSDHDDDLLESFAYQMALNDVDTELASAEQTWKDKGKVVQKGDTWDKFSLLDMATYLNEKGLMK